MNFQAAYDALLRRWGVPVEQLQLTGEFGTTHVNSSGPVDGHPLVLLAGHGATSPVWFSVAPQLSERHRVHAIDLIGDAGRSIVHQAPPRSVDDLMRWLTGVLAGLGVEQAMLCGHSYGAWIALTYALREPVRVGKLALIDPTDCFTSFKPGYLARALPMLLKPSPRRYESFLRWETRDIPIDPDWLRLAALATLEPTAKPVKPRRPTPAQLEHLQPELLVVVANQSRAHDPERLAQRAAAADASVVRMERATHHSLPAAHGTELADLLLKFSHAA